MKSKYKKKIIYLYILVLLITMTGCWDNMDINDRAFVSAVALDKGEDGRIEVTIQLLRPNVIKAGQEGGSEESAIWVSTTTGETVFDAIREQLQTVNRKPFYSHLRLIVVGEELAREGIRDVLDFFIRDHEVRITPKLLVAKGVKAKEIVNAKSKLETIPALHIEGVLENNISEAKTREVNLIDVLQELTAPHGSGVIGSIIVINKEKVEEIKDMKIEGAAVFKKDQLIGFLDSIQTRGCLFLRDEVKGGIINVDHPEEENKKIAIEIKRAFGKIDAKIENEKLVLSTNIEVKGTIGEQQGLVDLASQEMLEKVEGTVEKEIENNIKNALKVAKDEYKADFFGFGNEVASKYPHYWEEIKDDWDEEFSELPVKITTKVEINETGIIAQPIQIH